MSIIPKEKLFKVELSQVVNSPNGSAARGIIMGDQGLFERIPSRLKDLLGYNTADTTCDVSENHPKI